MTTIEADRQKDEAQEVLDRSGEEVARIQKTLRESQERSERARKVLRRAGYLR